MKFLRLLALPLAFAAVFLMRHMKRKVRFGEIWSPRLGHLVGNTECYLCERDAGRHDGFIDIWYPVRGMCSHPLIERKYRKYLHTVPQWLGNMIVVVNRLFRGFEAHEVSSEQLDRDVHNLWEKHGPHLSFTKSEERKGQKLLRSLGIPEGAKWVCLIVRDSAYLKATAPGQDSSYHDYRDSDIATYAEASVRLANKGYYVIRMGKVVEKPLPVRHNRIIDYASHKLTDFGQLYLGAKCEFCFGASTGFMAIPQVFNRPTVVVNFAPVEYISTWCKGLVIWKHHVKDDKRMTLKEIFDSGAGQFMAAKQFKDIGITLVDNTAQEITDVVLEMAEWLEWGGNGYDQTQEFFWNQFPLKAISPYNRKPLHGKPRVRVGRKFLENYW